ncbi:hypothetical protein J7E49_02370 [Variovorax paradoxus]|nr:hypothetical protein [Variovorax paradoxus]
MDTAISQPDANSESIAAHACAAVLVAAPASGQGKTTVTAALERETLEPDAHAR